MIERPSDGEKRVFPPTAMGIDVVFRGGLQSEDAGEKSTEENGQEFLGYSARTEADGWTVTTPSPQLEARNLLMEPKSPLAGRLTRKSASRVMIS